MKYLAGWGKTRSWRVVVLPFSQFTSTVGKWGDQECATFR
jgi:hypothetical protein